MAQGAPSTKDFLNKLKNKASVAAPVAPEMPQQEQAAAPAGMAPQTEDAIVRAGIQLGPQLLGLLAGGYEGAESAKRNVSDPFFAAQAEGAKNAAAQAKAQAEREEKLAEMAAKKEFGEKKLAIEDYEAKTKRMATRENGPQDFSGRLKKLSTTDRSRFDSAKMGFKAIQDMKSALNAGERTFSLIGDNPYTMAMRNFSEALGRMQSGGAINKDEEARFKAMGPTWKDSDEIKAKKLEQLEKEMESRINTLGFSAHELSDVTMSPAYNPTGKDPTGFMAQAQSAGMPSDKISQYAKQHGLTEEKAAQIILARKAAQGGKN